MAPKSSEAETKMEEAPMTEAMETSTEVVSSSLGKRKVGDVCEESGEKEDGSGDDSDYFDWDEAAKNWQDPDPVWDVDSFDDLEYDSPAENIYSDEEDEKRLRRYLRQVYESKGFYVDRKNLPKFLWHGVYPLTDLDAPAGKGMTVHEYMTDLALICVEKYNQDKGKNLEFHHVVRANMSGGSRVKSYITFMATEYPGGPLVEYQAKALKILKGEKIPILCRPSASH